MKKVIKKNILDLKILNKKVYNREDTIHIINKGDFQFQPILRKQVLPNSNLTQSELSYVNISEMCGGAKIANKTLLIGEIQREFTSIIEDIVL